MEEGFNFVFCVADSLSYLDRVFKWKYKFMLTAKLITVNKAILTDNKTQKYLPSLTGHLVRH